MKSFSIGSVKIEHPVILAPMEHVTNSIFRRVVKPFGASLMFTEFCSSDGLIYGKDKLWNMVRFHPSERPMTIQIFGSDPKVMGECAKRMEDLGADILDINCGCSVPKMAKCNGGAYLTRDLSMLQGVMESVRKAVKIPVTIKVRKGWDESRDTCMDIARMAQEIGFCAITVHGRTSVQGYNGTANWEAIDRVSRSVSIPVIGSGDVTSADEAYARLAGTGVSGVMIGRGVMGNPWVFREIVAFLKTGAKPAPPTREEKLRVVMEHFRTARAEMGDAEAVREMRRHLTWYMRGLPNAAAFRGIVHSVSDPDEIEKCIEAFFMGETPGISGFAA